MLAQSGNYPTECMGDSDHRAFFWAAWEQCLAAYPGSDEASIRAFDACMARRFQSAGYPPAVAWDWNADGEVELIPYWQCVWAWALETEDDPSSLPGREPAGVRLQTAASLISIAVGVVTILTFLSRRKR